MKPEFHSASPRKPTVCIVSHTGYGALCGGAHGSIGGVQWQTSLTARWLAQQGYPTSVLTWDEGGPGEETIGGVRVIKVCREDAGVKGLRFFHPKWTGLIRAMRRADADVYYHNCAECVTGQIALWCRSRRRAFVYSAASDADTDPSLPELKSRRERVLYRYGLRQADRIIVQTRTQQRRMKEVFSRDTVVIPVPCPGPTAEYSAPPDFGIRRVLWVGRVCKVKRPDRLLDLAEACPEMSFDLVGPFNADEYSEGIRERARRITNVNVHGAISRQRIPEFYQRAVLLCSTSQYEGFPNTFLEAWSHGRPIVSTFDPDGLIASRDLGIVVGDVAEMKRSIGLLLRAPDRWRTMSENGRRYYLDNHTLEAVMPRFEQVLQEAVAANAQTASRPHHG